MFTYAVLIEELEKLKIQYPFLKVGDIGRSVMGKRIPYLKIGDGEKKVFYNASHHANEWITSLLLIEFVKEYLSAIKSNELIFGEKAQLIYERTTLFLVPMVNPDGVDLVNGVLEGEKYKTVVKVIKETYPDIPFPNGWKANINGIDLNLQYPAGWEKAKKIKFSQGYTVPSPKNYVGKAPLSEPESKAVYDFTLENEFDLTISFHSQGKEIYYKYLDSEPTKSRDFAKCFEKVSGYEACDVPYMSSFAGYKDWFIKKYNKPSFTIEVGLGESPLPLLQFDEIYKDNLGILVSALLV